MKAVKTRKNLTPLSLLVLTLLITFMSTGWSGCLKSVDPSLEGMEKVVVQRVVDGDTFVTDDGRRVRLIGIDAPESVKPNTQPEPYGKESSLYLEELIEGEIVYLEQDVSETDLYNRLLRYVYLADGTFVNALILEEGYARHVVFPPDVGYQQELEDAEQEAKALQKGMWTAANP